MRRSGGRTESEDLGRRRYVAKASLDHFLRVVAVLSEVFDGNLLAGVVFLTIARAGVQHLTLTPGPGGPGPDGIYPDELRRPVSVMSVANFLGLSYETTRRHVSLLIERGYCVRVGARGVMAPAEVIRGSVMERLEETSYTATHQLLRALRRGPEDLFPG